MKTGRNETCVDEEGKMIIQTGSSEEVNASKT